jgi:hypothetical protein
MSRPKTHDPADDQPTSYFEWQRRADEHPELGGESVINTKLPALPASSPWGSGPGPGDEPTINREEDGDVMGTPIDQLP